MGDDKDKGILIFHTETGMKPIAPIDKNASLGDIMVMKEMFGDKNNKPDAISINNDLKWIK